MMKTAFRRAALLLLAALIISLLASCETPAPYGTFAPADAEKYKTGVEEAIFAVPAGYTVTMSSNMLAAVGEKDSFSLQCRHSDYVYGDLRKNFRELKAQLTAQYGDFETEREEDAHIAGQDALEVRYGLTVAGVEKSFVQYLFYAPKVSALEGTRFLLFTYTAPKGETDEELLKKVAETVSVKKDGFAPPEGFIAVENAAAKSLQSDRYALYCPDNWVFDLSLDTVAMRVPLNTVIANVSFVEIEAKGGLDAYASSYAAEHAAALDASGLSPLELYIVAALWRMKEELPEMHVIPKEDAANAELPPKEALAARRDDYLRSYVNEAGLTFSYVEFTAVMSDFDAHRKFYNEKNVRTDEPDAATETYRFRQYFIEKNGYIYLFTYTSTDAAFKNYLTDAEKVVKHFAFN